MQLSYIFSQDEKNQMIRIAENESIEEILKLSGKTILSKDEAVYLAKRVAPVNWNLARRIESHPGMRE